MSKLKIIAVTIAVTIAAESAAALAIMLSGVYSFDATDEHPQFVYSVIAKSVERSVARRANGIAVPGDLSKPWRIRRGLALYDTHCVRCHGAPGVAPETFALGMTPLAPPLVQSARERTARQIYWATRNGIKMTGMPAWEMRMDDQDIWSVTAFVRELPLISPIEYQRATGRTAQAAAATRAADRGPQQ